MADPSIWYVVCETWPTFGKHIRGLVHPEERFFGGMRERRKAICGVSLDAWLEQSPPLSPGWDTRLPLPREDEEWLAPEDRPCATCRGIYLASRPK